MKNSEAIHYIQAAAERVRFGGRRNGDGWCQDDIAQTAEGDECVPNHESAVRWCAIGAIRAGTGDELNTQPEYFVRRALAERGYERDLADWNDEDGRTVDDVLDLYGAAVSIAQEAIGMYGDG